MILNRARVCLLTVVTSAALLAAGCKPTALAARHHPSAASDAETGYTAPPAATAAVPLAGGRVEILGRASPGARVRLASPLGQATFANADTAGVWRLFLPGATGVRLFGLSAPVAGRPVQAEGYLALTPTGRLVQLRAGAGALCLKPLDGGLALLAADFDRKGVVVVSGIGPASAAITIGLDGQGKGKAQTHADGRFSLALNEPLTAGGHIVSASFGGGRVQEPLDISPPSGLKPGPFRADRAPGGWRIDWLTPGGGVQSTLIYDRGAA